MRDLVVLAANAGDRGGARHRYAVLRQTLGVEIDLLATNGGPPSSWPRVVVPDGEHGREELSGAPMVASRAVAAMAAVPRPFRGILEAPPDVHELYEDHEPELSAMADALWHALQRLAVDAIVRVYPHLADLTVTPEELYAFGWRDPRPPGLD